MATLVTAEKSVLLERPLACLGPVGYDKNIKGHHPMPVFELSYSLRLIVTIVKSRRYSRVILHLQSRG
eukprot:scaffold1355_cov165-Chaetoceros_neogracile.AAC.25